MDALRGINLVARFMLEICVLISVGYWGFKTGSGWLLRIVLGIGVPFLVAMIWGMFGAPKSTFHLQGLSLLLIEVVVFGSGVVALFLTKNSSLAWLFTVIIIINRVLMFVWRQ
jgi:Protein of unknown function (DUF2568)